MPRFAKMMRVLLQGLACGLVLLGAGVAAAHAQASLRNPSQPLLIYNAAGHTAPVRALLFVPEPGGALLSGGLDRVIHVWNVDGPKAGLNRTIRPPLWKEPTARVYAMAISRKPIDGAERLLAYAGTSTMNSSESNFIMLNHFPGGNGLATGEPVATLPPLIVDKEGNEKPAESGVRSWINSLSFNESGTLLASAGVDAREVPKPADVLGRIVIWDVPNRKIAHILPDSDWTRGSDGVTPAPYVGTVILSKDGKRVWSGGNDGYARVWDVASKAVRFGPPIGLPWPSQKVALHRSQVINANAMAVTPDESTLIVGREDGSLTRYDSATLQNPVALIPKAELLGPIEAIAVHPTLPLVGLARINRKFQSDAEEPYTECLVEIRSTVDGHLVQKAPNVSDRVLAAAFNDDGSLFAYSGGESQAIHLLKVGENAPPPVVHRGEGATIHEVGLNDDGSVVAFRRLSRGQKAPLEAYDLKRRRVLATIPAELKTIRSTDAWKQYKLTALDLETLRLDWGTGSATLTWDTEHAGRWFSYCVIPHPTNDQVAPLVVVGCESRIVVFAPYLDAARKFGYRPTRQFRGHSGPVFAMAPSGDRRWLITGGGDQLIRLWSLGSAYDPPQFGAGFPPRADGQLAIGTLDADGFAREAGLRVGDVVEIAAIKRQTYGPMPGARPLAQFVKDLPATPSGPVIGFQIRRGGKSYRTMSRMQDDAVVSLFVTRSARGDAPGVLNAPPEREWVMWNVDGYYDTSVTADRRFLGWHRNTPNAQRTSADHLKPTTFFPIRTFEDLLRNPEVIDGLLSGRPRSAVLPKDPVTNEPIDVAERVDQQSPPTLRVTTTPAALGDSPIKITDAILPFVVELEPGAGFPPSPLRDLQILIDGQEVLRPNLPALDRKVTIEEKLPLSQAGVHTVVFVATNREGRDQKRSVVVDHQPLKPRKVERSKPPTLLVVSIGVDRFRDEKTFPPIRTARLDVEKTAEDMFVGRGLQGYFPTYPEGVPPFARPLIVEGGKDRTVRADSVRDALAALQARLNGERPLLPLWNDSDTTPPPLGEGDTLIFVVSTHVIGEGKKSPRLTTWETDGAKWREQAVDTDPITHTLGELVRKGCRVVTIIDGYHGQDDRQSVGVREWAYRLDEKGIVVCLSADNNPSPTGVDDENSPFFRALYGLADRRLWGAEARPDQRLTLDLFRKLLAANLDQETGRTAQPPYVNTPFTIQGDTPLFDPPAPLDQFVQAQEGPAIPRH